MNFFTRFVLVLFLFSCFGAVLHVQAAVDRSSIIIYLQDLRNNNEGSLPSSSSSSAQSSTSSIQSSVSSASTQLYLATPRDHYTPGTRQLLAGGILKEKLVSIKLEENLEDVRINKINLVSSYLEHSIQYLEVYVDDEITPYIATNTNCDVPSPTAGKLYCAHTDLFIEDDSFKYIHVVPVLKSEAEGARSGDAIQIGLYRSAGDYYSTETYGVYSNQRHVSFLEDNILSSVHEVVFSGLEDISNAHPGGKLSEYISSGKNQFAIFKFKTLENMNGSNVIVNNVLFSITAQNVLLDNNSFYLYEQGKPNQKVACSSQQGVVSGSSITGTFFVECSDMVFNNSLDTSLESGTSSVFVLETDVMNNAIKPSAVSRLYAEISEYSEETDQWFGIDANNDLSHFSWIDSEGNNGDGKEFYWLSLPYTSVRSTVHVQE